MCPADIAGISDSEGKLHQVTEISFQRKRQQRRSVFIDGEYSFSMGPATFEMFPLQKGQELSEKQIRVIRRHEEYEYAKKMALDYLNRRMRSQWELKRYLERKDIQPSEVRRVIQFSREHGFIDDHKFAEVYARELVQINRYGIRKIWAKLKSKRIPNTIIKEVLNKTVSRDDQLRLAQQFAHKKRQQLGEVANPREKVYRYLVQRGFTADIIHEALQSNEA